MKRVVCFLLVFIFILPASSANAQDKECAKNPQTEGQWKQLNALSNSLGYKICLLVTGETGAEAVTVEELRKVVSDWKTELDVTSHEINDVLSDNNISNAAAYFSNLVGSKLMKYREGYGSEVKNSKLKLPTIEFNQADLPFQKSDITVIAAEKNESRIFFIKDFNTSTIEKCRNKYTDPRAIGNACEKYVGSWAQAASAYADLVSAIEPYHVAQASVKYSADWEEYFSNSRSQTFLDRSLTTVFYRDELKSSMFQKAPDTQYILLHPGVVMEYVDNAQDGEQLEAAFVIEWIGINRWRGCDLWFVNVPCGASVVSTYSDRAGVDDMSIGLMFHINNHYSLGADVRGGDIGLFVTIDLLKAFENQEERVGDWSKEVDGVMSNN